MFSSEVFDRWAKDYDETVRACAVQGEYPFAGYFDALDQLFTLADSRRGASVLDLGFGTAALTRRLWEQGHPITGVDFSPEMVAIAAAKMPGAELYRFDFAAGLPPELDGRRFDFIVASYALHHLTDPQKYTFLRTLRGRLNPDGAVLIADLCFPTRAALEECRAAYGDEWDDGEYYFVEAELRAALPEYHIDAIPVSFCGDVLILSPED